MTVMRLNPAPSAPTRSTGAGRRVALARRVVGGMFLVGAGVHVGIVAADTEVYRRFADSALPVVRTAWREVFMAQPTGWGLAVSAGELAIGTAILASGPWPRRGLLAAIAFHVALMLFGWWAWVWSVPMLVLLVCSGGRRDPPSRMGSGDHADLSHHDGSFMWWLPFAARRARTGSAATRRTQVPHLNLGPPSDG
jgi:hypothetical protein